MQLVALGIGVAWALLVLLTADGRDLWHSPWWLAAWLGLPVAAAVIGRHGVRRPWLVAVSLCVPLALAFVVHDLLEDDGAPAVWPIGAGLVLALGGVCTVAARPPRPGERSGGVG